MGAIKNKAFLSASMKNASDNAMASKFDTARDVINTHPSGLLNEPKEVDVESKIIVLPIANVLDNPFNARTIYDEDIISKRAASIATNGQQEAVKVTAIHDKPGFYYLIDGHYRKRGLLAAGKTDIRCIVKPQSNDLDLYKLSFLLNEERSAQTPLDNAYAWNRLIDKKVVSSSDEIAELLGISKSLVSKTMSTLQLPEDALAKIQEKPQSFGVSICYELLLIYKQSNDIKHLIDLVQKIINDGMSRAELERIREGLEKGGSRKLRDVSRQHKISAPGTENGKLKDWDNGRILLDIKITDPSLKREIIEEIKLKFGISD